MISKTLFFGCITEDVNLITSYRLLPLHSPAYICPGIGSETALQLNEQWPTVGLLVGTAPHFTGNTETSSSPVGGWQAALIAALQPAARGIPKGYLRNPKPMPPSTKTLPTMMTKMMAMQEYPHEDME